MGKALVRFFSEAQDLGGLQAAIKLAKLTGMAAMQAENTSESPELLKRFESAMSTVRQDFAGIGAGTRQGIAQDRARRLHRLYADLLISQASWSGDLRKTAARVTEVATEALEVERASVWLYDSARTAISCVDLYERGPKRHGGGTVLAARDYPTYFKALETERVIDAEDAHTDSRTSCFSAGYLKAEGIRAMLDVPIWASMRMVGVVCHEHLGAPRKWLHAEADFAFLMSTLIARAVK